jgi:hypothetical protein
MWDWFDNAIILTCYWNLYFNTSGALVSWDNNGNRFFYWSACLKYRNWMLEFFLLIVSNIYWIEN